MDSADCICTPTLGHIFPEHGPSPSSQVFWGSLTTRSLGSQGQVPCLILITRWVKSSVPHTRLGEEAEGAQDSAEAEEGLRGPVKQGLRQIGCKCQTGGGGESDGGGNSRLWHTHPNSTPTLA